MVGEVLVAVDTAALTAAEHPVVSGGLAVKGTDGGHLVLVVAVHTAGGVIGLHAGFSTLMVMGVVAGTAGWVLVRKAAQLVYALLQLLVAAGAHLLLLSGREHRVYLRVNIVAGHAGNPVDHVQGVAPVLRGVVFMATEAGQVLVSGTVTPVGAEAGVR